MPLNPCISHPQAILHAVGGSIWALHLYAVWNSSPPSAINWSSWSASYRRRRLAFMSTSRWHIGINASQPLYKPSSSYSACCRGTISRLLSIWALHLYAVWNSSPPSAINWSSWSASYRRRIRIYNNYFHAFMSTSRWHIGINASQPLYKPSSS
jgi:hypothetical protein